jgi:hypothetical protein
MVIILLGYRVCSGLAGEKKTKVHIISLIGLPNKSALHFQEGNWVINSFPTMYLPLLFAGQQQMFIFMSYP